MILFNENSLTQGHLRYTQNGILHMLDRNRRIKPKPERFQDVVEEFDVIFTVEERIYDAVLEGVFMSYDVIVQCYNSRIAMLH